VTVYIRTKIARGKTYYQIVEGVREGKRVRQRVVLALGRTADPKAVLGQWQRQIVSLRKRRPSCGSTAGLSKMLQRRIGRMDADIADLEAKIGTLDRLIKSKKVGTTPKKGEG
jgi:hypothetical protein